ncbi:unnamed protein product [Brugia pahangi]|uniref:NADAR domain-containing protein n=1 Tax=Brugia pahangi TaxID=6280 RepID=A0A0N4TKM4_BRUPA|nr:unnamed protein product [Brugia pahangi]
MIRFQSPTKHYPREPHKTLEYRQTFASRLQTCYVYNVGLLKFSKAMEQYERHLAEGCIGIRLVTSSLSPYLFVSSVSTTAGQNVLKMWRQDMKWVRENFGRRG